MIEISEIRAAAERIAGEVHRTPVLSARSLGERAGVGQSEEHIGPGHPLAVIAAARSPNREKLHDRAGRNHDGLDGARQLERSGA